MIYQIKKNRIINELNKELSGYSKTQQPGSLTVNYFYDSVFLRIVVQHHEKKIIISNKLYMEDFNVDIFYEVIRKFTGCQNYNILWTF